MPWEKSFDESEVIDKVMHVFWEKGYAAASISDITAATGLKRGSLYNAFEGKDDLFLRSLQKYDTEYRCTAQRMVEQIENPVEAISAFFALIVKSTLDDPDRKGCLLVNTSLDIAVHDQQTKKLVAVAFQAIAKFFETSIRRGQELGEIPCSVQPRPTAKTLVSCLVGIRVLGRGTYGKTALNQIADQAKRLIQDEDSAQ